jgi:hypothetical protein
MDLRDTFIKILEWVGSNPLRLVILLVIGVFGMMMWFVYTEKDAFMASYRAQQALPHMNGKYEETTTFIMKRSDADIVAIFEVNPLLNTRKLVSFVSRGEGHLKTWDGLDVGLFTKNLNNNKDVISLMSGEIPCSAYDRPQSFLGFVYLEKGITYMCRISVPPDPSKFIGQISVGWKNKPADIDIARTIISVGSEMLWNQ